MHARRLPCDEQEGYDSKAIYQVDRSSSSVYSSLRRSLASMWISSAFSFTGAGGRAEAASFFLIFLSRSIWSSNIIIAMKITKSTVVLLVFVLILSILVANVADLISVESHLPDEALRDNNGKMRWSRPKYYNIEDSYDHLIWFIQVCCYLYLKHLIVQNIAIIIEIRHDTFYAL